MWLSECKFNIALEHNSYCSLCKGDYCEALSIPWNIQIKKKKKWTGLCTSHSVLRFSINAEKNGNHIITTHHNPIQSFLCRKHKRYYLVQIVTNHMFIVQCTTWRVFHASCTLLSRVIWITVVIKSFQPSSDSEMFLKEISEGNYKAQMCRNPLSYKDKLSVSGSHMGI